MLTYDTGGRQFRFDTAGPDAGTLDGALVAALVADDVLVTVESENVGVKQQGDSADPSHAQLRIPRLDADRGFTISVSGQPAQGVSVPTLGQSAASLVDGTRS